MAASTASKSRPRAGGLNLRLPTRGRAAAKPGAQPVSAVKRAKPNPVLLGGLALVAVAALVRVADPGLFGSGSSAVSSFPPPVTGRHFLTGRGATPTTAVGGTSSNPTSRPSRDPFTPPPGFTGS